ncbi:MAG: hypothetical protein HZB91_08950 [Elusimicrobia bacterium]|nr:hypothetical protein [Elusimicrobiota bacterium]
MKALTRIVRGAPAVGAGFLLLAGLAGCMARQRFDTSPEVVERAWILPRETQESEFWRFLPLKLLPGYSVFSVNEAAGRAVTGWRVLESCSVGGPGGPFGPCKRARASIRLDRSEPRRVLVAVLQQEAFVVSVQDREVLRWRDAGSSPSLADGIISLLGKNW